MDNEVSVTLESKSFRNIGHFSGLINYFLDLKMPGILIYSLFMPYVNFLNFYQPKWLRVYCRSYRNRLQTTLPSSTSQNTPMFYCRCSCITIFNGVNSYYNNFEGFCLFRMALILVILSSRWISRGRNRILVTWKISTSYNCTVSLVKLNSYNYVYMSCDIKSCSWDTVHNITEK